MPAIHYTGLRDLYYSYGVTSREALLSSPTLVRQYLSGELAPSTVEAILSTDPHEEMPAAPAFAAHASAVVRALLHTPDDLDVASPAVHAKDVLCPPAALRRHLIRCVSALVAARNGSAAARRLIPNGMCWADADGVLRSATMIPSGRLSSAYRTALHGALLRNISCPDLVSLLADPQPDMMPALRGAAAILAFIDARSADSLPGTLPLPTVALIRTLRMGIHSATWLDMPDALPELAKRHGSSHSLARLSATMAPAELHALAAPVLHALRTHATSSADPCLLPTTSATDAPATIAAISAFAIQAREDAALLSSMVADGGPGNEERAARKFFRLLAERMLRTRGAYLPGVTVVNLVSMPVAAALMYFWVWVAPLMHFPQFAAGVPHAARAAGGKVADMLAQLGMDQGEYDDALMRSALSLAHAPLHARP